jgi:MtN3 and saliva related transmembrane protein
VVTLIGSLAAVLTTVCWLPQVIKTVRQREAHDFSWTYLVMLLVGISGWATYGILRHDLPITLCNGVTGLLVLMVAAVKAHGGRMQPGEPR